MIVSADEYRQIRQQAEAQYPAECCGVILARNGAPQDRLLVPCRNIQNELHAKDPARHPRDARTAFYIDPRDLLRVARLEGGGYRVSTIYHSHIDAGAYFSETDRRQALVGGEPAYPEATHVVLSVVGGKVAARAAFAWSPEKRDFVPVDVGEEAP